MAVAAVKLSTVLAWVGCFGVCAAVGVAGVVDVARVDVIDGARCDVAVCVLVVVVSLLVKRGGNVQKLRVNRHSVVFLPVVVVTALAVALIVSARHFLRT